MLVLGNRKPKRINNIKASACRRFGRFCSVRQMMIELQRTIKARMLKPTHEPEELNHSASSAGNSLSLFFANLSINALTEWLIGCLSGSTQSGFLLSVMTEFTNCRKTL